MDKNKRSILIGVCFIVVTIVAIFLIDCFQTANLLKSGTRAMAIVTAKYYEINVDNNDTTGYSMRLEVLRDSNLDKTQFVPFVRLEAFVKKGSFYKYNEGDKVKVVYYNDDTDHARLLEEIQ